MTPNRLTPRERVFRAYNMTPAQMLAYDVGAVAWWSVWSCALAHFGFSFLAGMVAALAISHTRHALESAATVLDDRNDRRTP